MKKSRTYITASILVVAVTLSGCNLFKNEFGKMKSALKGREAIIQTYDESSNIIDRVKGKSIDLSADSAFSIIAGDGSTVEKSSVINITVGGKPMMHVGSSLILYEDGILNVFEEYAKTVDITNNDRSTPFVNKMVNGIKNLTAGHDMLILIRSQTGKPLAAFSGNSVSYFSTSIDKSTGFIIDGKYLLIYRCDYTVYSKGLLQNMETD